LNTILLAVSFERAEVGMNSRKIVFVVNPHAGNGKTGREWPQLSMLAGEMLGPFETCITAQQGDATDLTRNCLGGGADVVVCVGGDGSLNEVINGFFHHDRPIRKGAALGFIPNGTGCDVARSFPMPPGIKPALESIKIGSTRTMDVGRIRFLDHKGEKSSRYFHNIASFGMGGEVVARVNRTSKAFGPFLTFIWGTLLTLLTYTTKEVALTLDDGGEFTRDIFHIAVANGRYQGGGMFVAPDARMDDGLFHITVIRAMALPLVLARLPKLYNGKIKTIPQVELFTGKRVVLRSPHRVLFDMDGEQNGALPAEVEIVPAAIEFITTA
jgi:YegS/Rv2252/BmrU family lipid kinase